MAIAEKEKGGRWYEVKFDMDDNDTFVATVPDFPEVTTFGSTQEEALRNALRAIEEAIASRIADADDVPHPLEKTKGKGRFVELPLLTYLKAGLYMISRGDGVTRAELARRMGVHREQVDRLFRIDHKSQIDQIEAAAKALGVSISVGIPFPAAA
ncbi:MAG: type II toxin-antitoxin system HicB family antitoxin [Bauldia sp.]